MLLKRKGYALIEWSLIFGVVLGVLALTQKVFTKELERKMLVTSQYIMWDALGEEPDFDEGSDVDNSRTWSETKEARRIVRHENHAGQIRTFIDENYVLPDEDSNRHVERLGISVQGNLVGEGIDQDFITHNLAGDELVP